MTTTRFYWCWWHSRRRRTFCFDYSSSSGERETKSSSFSPRFNSTRESVYEQLCGSDGVLLTRAVVLRRAGWFLRVRERERERERESCSLFDARVSGEMFLRDLPERGVVRYFCVLP